MTRGTMAALLTTVALSALATTATAQEAAISPGGQLVERQVRDRTLTAQRRIEVYTRPEREPWLPIFWKAPEPAGTIEEGERVEIVSVGETSLFWDRLVWLEIARQENEETVWFRIGPDESASSALWRDWARDADPERPDEP